MKKSLAYVITLAVMSGGAVYGAAQTAYSGSPAVKAFFEEHDHFWEEGQKRARETGYQDGLNDGKHDAVHHRHSDPEHTRAYKKGDGGYIDRYGDRRRYQEAYREGYRRGYEEGYHHEEHR